MHKKNTQSFMFLIECSHLKNNSTKTMIKFLKKPYPFNTDMIHNAKIIFFISFVFGIFMFFFQPFELLNSTFTIKISISAIVAGITFAILSLNLLVLPSYITRLFDNEKWNIFKEILWNTFLLAQLAAAYFFYFKYAKLGTFNGIVFAKIVAISIVPISILVLLNQNRLLQLNLNDALDLNKKLLSKFTDGDNTVLFESEYKKDSITLTASTISVIKSAGNYIEIYWKEKHKINKHLVRMKLQEAEELLKHYNFIFRCHRTYLINTNEIINAEGNSLGLKLNLKNLDFQVPVSRPYVEKLKKII